MKKALIVTDSLGLPRGEYSTEESWVFNFMSTLKDDFVFYTELKRGATSNVLKGLQANFDFLRMDMMIIQLGICDCTRRPIPRKIASLKHNIIANQKIANILKQIINGYLYLFTSKIKIQNCSPKDYKKNIKEAIEFGIKSNRNCRIILLAIGDVGVNMKNKVYGIEKDIEQYNCILEVLANEYENVTYLNWKVGHCADDYVIEEDGHHLNIYGNGLLLTKLLKEVREG